MDIKHGKYEEYLSPVEYPKELYDYAKTNYYEIKREQMQLIGRIR